MALRRCEQGNALGERFSFVANPSFFTEQLSTHVGEALSEVSAMNLAAPKLIKSVMAAYCGCCGAEITGRGEACEACGTPRHGMMPSGLPSSPAEVTRPLCSGDQALSEEEEESQSP
jgi:hypothetical protein